MSKYDLIFSWEIQLNWNFSAKGGSDCWYGWCCYSNDTSL